MELSWKPPTTCQTSSERWEKPPQRPARGSGGVQNMHGGPDVMAMAGEEARGGWSADWNIS